MNPNNPAKKAESRHRGDRLRRVLGAAALLLGLALVLYPTVANRLNEAQNKAAIEGYRRAVESIPDDSYEKMLAAAQAYNQRLFQAKPYIAALSDEQEAEYETLLNVDGAGMMGYIEVPKAHIELAIYHGTAETTLQAGVGHLAASSLPVPGESVHAVLTGHSGLPSARLFTDLDQLAPGDTFTLHILRETLTYQVENIRRVAPEELQDLHIEAGQELCTLMTCTPYGINTHRLVVTGRRVATPAYSEQQTEAQLTNSRWSRWFVLLPVGLFLAALVIAFVIWKKRKKRKKA